MSDDEKRVIYGYVSRLMPETPMLPAQRKLPPGKSEECGELGDITVQQVREWLAGVDGDVVVNRDVSGNLCFDLEATPPSFTRIA